jgi:hypothetical protein
MIIILTLTILTLTILITTIIITITTIIITMIITTKLIITIILIPTLKLTIDHTFPVRRPVGLKVLSKSQIYTEFQDNIATVSLGLSKPNRVQDLLESR